MRRFEHSGDLGELGRLREAGELIGGHRQIGTWSLEDVVAVNTEKLFVEVALEWPSLRVELLLGHHEGILVCSALCTVDVLVLASGAFLLGLTVLRGAIDADIEDHAPRGEGEEIVQWRFQRGFLWSLGTQSLGSPPGWCGGTP